MCLISGTWISGVSSGANMERAEGDTSWKFDPQVSRRWGWSHLDRLLQGTANSSSLINLIQYLDLYEDATVFWFHLLVLHGEGYNIGFGTCTGKVLPALPWANISSLQFMESRWSQRSSCAESTKLRSLVCLKPSYGNWILGVVFLECGKGNWSLLEYKWIVCLSPSV